MNFVDSFAGSNASIGLVIGSLAALILTILMFTVRKTLPFDEAMSSLIKGFEAMVPAILILTLAWTLKSMTDSLGAAEYVSTVVASSAPASHHLPGSSLPGICHRYILGNLRYSDTYLHRSIPRSRPIAHHLYLCLHGWCCMWRPHLTYQRYHHHGECRSRVQACAPCFITVAIRADCSYRQLPDIHRGRFHPYTGNGNQCHHFVDIRYGNAWLCFILFK